MVNDITKSSNWQVFSLSEQQQKFTQFIDMITNLEDGSHTNGWVKWKNASDQIVILTPNYVYKIYCIDYTVGRYFSEIREKLAEIYREDFGIYWDIKTIYTKDCIYQFEQREKLEVLSEEMMPFDIVMVSWAKTLEKLEQKLLLPRVSKQLSNTDVVSIKLVRDCINKYEDYGITKNGDIVLLDDSDWFLAPIDKDGKWISLKYNAYNIISSIGESYFCPVDYSRRIRDNSLLQKSNEYTDKWIISHVDELNGVSMKQFVDYRKKLLEDNIQVLNTKKPLENKQLYYEKDEDDISLIASNQALISSK